MWTLNVKSSSRRTKRRDMSVAMQDEGEVGSLPRKKTSMIRRLIESLTAMQLLTEAQDR